MVIARSETYKQHKIDAIHVAITRVVIKRLQRGASKGHIRSYLLGLKENTWRNNSRVCVYIDKLIKRFS